MEKICDDVLLIIFSYLADDKICLFLIDDININIRKKYKLYKYYKPHEIIKKNLMINKLIYKQFCCKICSTFFGEYKSYLYMMQYNIKYKKSITNNIINDNIINLLYKNILTKENIKYCKKFKNLKKISAIGSTNNALFYLPSCLKKLEIYPIHKYIVPNTYITILNKIIIPLISLKVCNPSFTNGSLNTLEFLEIYIYNNIFTNITKQMLIENQKNLKYLKICSNDMYINFNKIHFKINTLVYYGTNATMDYLPDTLINLEIGNNYIGKLNHLPWSLKYLKIGDNYKYMLKNLPENLISFDIGYRYKNLVNLPYSIKEIKIKYDYKFKKMLINYCNKQCINLIIKK